jgi:hypothetical protein
VLELGLERSAELREWLPVQVQALEDDRRAVLELREDALDVGRSGKRSPPEVRSRSTSRTERRSS